MTTPPRPSSSATPGKPKELSSFIDVHKQEVLTAAYLGFGDIVSFRKLLLHLSIFRAFCAFVDTGGLVNDYETEPLRIIRDSHDLLWKDIDTKATWPLRPERSDISDAVDKRNAKHRIAHVLVGLVDVVHSWTLWHELQRLNKILLDLCFPAPTRSISQTS